MDKLTREALEHEKISETLPFFEKSLHLLPPSKKGKWAKHFIKFLDEYIVKHFEFEENDIFPFIMTKGTKKEKVFIQELQEEHTQILKIVDRYKKLISKHDSSLLEKQIDKFIGSSKPIIEETLKHAFKEDEELFPILEKYKIDLNKF